jgi:TorA maturation chaperone TorD
MIELSAIRSNMYGCLSLCFDYPSEALVDPASAAIIAQTLEPLSRLCRQEPLAAEAAGFQAVLLMDLAQRNHQLVELQVEYSRLFIGPFKPEVYPYESVFLHRFGSDAEAIQELLSLYRHEGLTLAPDFKERPDHISLELEFMAHLCSMEIEAGESQNSETESAYRQRQQMFLKDHIMNWVPALSSLVEEATVVEFYRQLARLTREFVIWDYGHCEASDSLSSRASELAAANSRSQRRQLCHT